MYPFLRFLEGGVQLVLVQVVPGGAQRRQLQRLQPAFRPARCALRSLQPHMHTYVIGLLYYLPFHYFIILLQPLLPLSLT